MSGLPRKFLWNRNSPSVHSDERPARELRHLPRTGSRSLVRRAGQASIVGLMTVVRKGPMMAAMLRTGRDDEWRYRLGLKAATRSIGGRISTQWALLDGRRLDRPRFCAERRTSNSPQKSRFAHSRWRSSKGRCCAASKARPKALRRRRIARESGLAREGGPPGISAPVEANLGAAGLPARRTSMIGAVGRSHFRRA